MTCHYFLVHNCKQNMCVNDEKKQPHTELTLHCKRKPHFWSRVRAHDGQLTFNTPDQHQNTTQVLFHLSPLSSPETVSTVAVWNDNHFHLETPFQDEHWEVKVNSDRTQFTTTIPNGVLQSKTCYKYFTSFERANLNSSDTWQVDATKWHQPITCSHSYKHVGHTLLLFAVLAGVLMVASCLACGVMAVVHKCSRRRGLRYRQSKYEFGRLDDEEDEFAVRASHRQSEDAKKKGAAEISRVFKTASQKRMEDVEI